MVLPDYDDSDQRADMLDAERVPESSSAKIGHTLEDFLVCQKQRLPLRDGPSSMMTDLPEVAQKTSVTLAG
jgi:hypothetical protein